MKKSKYRFIYQTIVVTLQTSVHKLERLTTNLMKRLFPIVLTLVLLMTSCNKLNPFLTEWDTPYGIPPFDTFKESDYIPAIKMGIHQQRAEIDAIIASDEKPDFENTIAAFERSGKILDRVSLVLFNVCESDATPSLLKIVDRATPIITKHNSDIFMNQYFFAKVKAVYDSREELNLTREQQMVLKNMYHSFIMNGIALDKVGQKRMREINSELASLTLEFGNNLLSQSNDFAKEFGKSVSEYPEAMASCEDRELREKMFNAYSNRCNHDDKYDNKNIVLKLASLRLEKAKLLGYENAADMILSDKMAGDSKTVDAFLKDIMDAATVRAKEEVADMQAIMDQDVAAGLLPEGSAIQPWDWFYYAEKVRKAKYNLDENEVRQYFKMDNVRAGVFNNASRLYGIQFEKLDSVALYNPEAEAFKVTDADGSLVGIIITDYFPRSTKRGGAWMTNYVNQEINVDGVDIRPVIVNVGNFAKPEADKPSLLTIDHVETMFHEFGHALHGLLSKCTYKDVSGASVARDFVELPSQINENWAFSKEALSTYAFHYQTGEQIPDSLVAKIQAAGNFNQGFMTSELAAASILDMKWHEITDMEGVDVLSFEKKACEEMGLVDEIIPRYRSTYFNHVFGGSGYSAGYYSYLWAEVLDQDAFELFRQKGIYDKETAMSFRHNILEQGGSEEPMTLYKRFRGAEPDPSALLRSRGLLLDAK